MALVALGPLKLSHEDLWRLSWGEVEDLLYAWRYAEYLESRHRAQHATWILNGSGNLKHTIRVEDLVGHWVDGQVMSKGDYHEFLKRKIKARKEGGRDG